MWHISFSPCFVSSCVACLQLGSGLCRQACWRVRIHPGDAEIGWSTLWLCLCLFELLTCNSLSSSLDAFNQKISPPLPMHQVSPI